MSLRATLLSHRFGAVEHSIRCLESCATIHPALHSAGPCLSETNRSSGWRIWRGRAQPRGASIVLNTGDAVAEVDAELKATRTL